MSRAKRISLTAVLVFATGLPLPVAAQISVVVEGRVYDAISSRDIQNAIVTLEGHGATLSSVRGTFRFPDVRPGDYMLRVAAFGYADLAESLAVISDTIVAVPLDAAPLPLDPIIVELGTLDFDGRVRDPVRDSNLLAAQVLSNQGHEEWTNEHGRFDLDDVFEGVPLRIVIRAFGYLPLDTTFVPDDEERYAFDLVHDPLVERMIEVQVERLEDRAGDLLYQFRPALGRDDLSRYTGFGTLRTVLEAKYPAHILRMVACVIFDEQQIRTPEERRFVLETAIPEELERIEFLEFPGPERALMLRVYTRAFFQEMIATNRQLRTPIMHTHTRVCS